MPPPGMSGLLVDVRGLKSIIISVLPDLLQKLDVIDKKIEMTVTDDVSHASACTQTDEPFPFSQESDTAEPQDPPNVPGNSTTNVRLPLVRTHEDDEVDGPALSASDIKQEIWTQGRDDDIVVGTSYEPSTEGFANSCSSNTNQIGRLQLDTWMLNNELESFSGVGEATEVNGGIEYTMEPSTSSTSLDVFAPRRSRPAVSRPTGKRWKCRYCPKDFFAPSHVKRHEVSHTGVRPFACTVCPKTFTRKDTLYSHMLCHGTTAFECQKCMKKFPLFHSLARHQKFYCRVSARDEGRDGNNAICRI